MKPVAEHNLASFSELSIAEMADWLTVALEEFGDPKLGMIAFSPVADGGPGSETVAAAMERGLAHINPAARRRFIRSLERVVASWPADAHEVWPILVELAWRLNASEAVDVLAARASNTFLGELFGADRRLFKIVLDFCRQTLAYGHSAGALFIRRLVKHPLFQDSDALPTFRSLCERDPRHWTDHLSALRTQLVAQANRLGREKGAARAARFFDDLMLFLKDAVGIEDLADAMNRLYLVKGGEEEALADNWFVDRVVEHFCVRIQSDRVWIAPLDRPDNLVLVGNIDYFDVVFDGGAGDLTDSRYALGPSRVAVPEYAVG